MDSLMAYLRIPSYYAAGLRRLRWTPEGDAIEFGDGGTFAFPGEFWPFLEGFLSQRPLIHFGHILHLLYLLKVPITPFLGHPKNVLMRAFVQANRPYRNAGAFFGVLCADVPAAPDPVRISPLETFELEVGASEPFFTLQNGDNPALPGEIFESRVLFALSSRSFEEILHWFRHGRGPVGEAGEEIARAVRLDQPRSLQSVLAELAQHERLRGAMPFVEQLVSALTLPPRRLQRPDLPLGGYSDVTTRGQVEQLLPSQFAFDDLEFVRRHAERELLYFHREDPHVHPREDLVVLLDQGVRAWGEVRLMLTAALFALGRLAERRRIPFLIATTSGGGELLDPLQAAAGDLQALIECSDLSPHPATALARVVSEETPTARDMVLLTHPRNLAEPEVIAAARKLRAEARLFAAAVDEKGEVRFSAVRGGAAVLLNRFHVDPERGAPPPPVKTAADPQTVWRGDVEPVPFPFRFGLSIDQKPIHLAFDSAGEWLLVAAHSGMLHAVRTDGSCSEILPRGLVQGRIIADVAQVLGVAGGFVVRSAGTNAILLLHYDLASRTCTGHRFASVDATKPVFAYYLRKLHTVVIRRDGDLSCIQLSTGDRRPIRAAVASPDPWMHQELWDATLPQQRANGPDSPEATWIWPKIAFDSDSGAIQLFFTVPAWDEFTPLEDNRPILQGTSLESADCQGHTLAASFIDWRRPHGAATLRLFRGPQGVPLASFPHSRGSQRYVLSDDGRLLARQVGRGHVQIRTVGDPGTDLRVLSAGRFHPQLHVELGECWLSIRIGNTIHFARWDGGSLILKAGQWHQMFVQLQLIQSGLLNNGVVAVPGRLPGFLPTDAGSRFQWAAWHNLIAVVDRFGEVALFEQSGEVVCMFFVFRNQIASWMPDGTCLGPMSLLGRPATPGAREKIGAALRAAWERGERTVQ